MVKKTYQKYKTKLYFSRSKIFRLLLVTFIAGSEVLTSYIQKFKNSSRCGIHIVDPENQSLYVLIEPASGANSDTQLSSLA